jgi:hypothetical protein
MIDLFEHYEELPKKVQDIIAEFGDTVGYLECQSLLIQLEPFGYTFEYDLDAIPYDLRKVNTYEIKILTKSGPQTVIYKDNAPLQEFETEVFNKYGDFTTLSSKLI